MKIRITALVFLIMACTEAFACTCMGPYKSTTIREVAEWYASQSGVELIFEGEVISQELRSGSLGPPQTAMSMTPGGRFRVVSFAVTRVFRGRKEEHVSVVTGLGAGDCGYDFQTDHAYLVYASKGPSGFWFTSICTGTEAIEDAGTAVRFLSGEKPTADDLLSPQAYAKQYKEKILPTRTGSVCGYALKPDGTPLKGADVELWELRDDGLPSRSATDPNTTRDDGHFCIQFADPAHYLLTVEDSDFDHDARYMAFYPGVKSRDEAVPLEIKPGVHLPDVKVTTFREPLYMITIRVVTPDGSPVSYKNGCGVEVHSIYRDPLSYHINHALEDGSYTFGYIPQGKYVITTYFQPDFADGEMKPFPEASKWKVGRQELIVQGDTEVVVHLEPASPK